MDLFEIFTMKASKDTIFPSPKKISLQIVSHYLLSSTYHYNLSTTKTDLYSFIYSTWGMKAFDAVDKGRYGCHLLLAWS